MLHDMIRAFGRTLAQTEWLSPDKLRLYQEPLISKLLQHAQKNTDLYRDRFDFDPDSADAIDGAWSAIPILTRAQAAENYDRMVSRSVPPETGPASDGVTSGSTGYPLRHRRSQLALVASQALNERMFRWWDVDGRKPFARIAYDRTKTAAPPDGATYSGWHSSHPEGQHYVLSTASDIEEQARWLAARRPAYLSSYSSILKELARHFQRADAKLQFDLVFSFGTVVDEEARDLCRGSFGAEIADAYGAEETGHLAAQCAQCGEYHISAEAAVVEVLREDGRAARPGEIGRIVTTPLYNYAQPLIRYEIGDLAEVGSAKARCRRGLPSLRRILGRYRNVFRFRDGKVAWPDAASFKLYELLPLRQGQILQLDVDRIEIRYVPDATGRAFDPSAVAEKVRSVLQQPVDVQIRAVDAIERSPSGKFEDCISLVPPR